MPRSQTLSHSPAANTRAEQNHASGIGFINAASKKAVSRRLDQLKHGAVDLYDSTGRSSHGNGHHEQSASLIVRNPHFYRETLIGGGLGFAESYLDGHWETPDLAELLRVFVRDIAVAHQHDKGLARLKEPLLRVGSRLARNTLRGSRKNIAAHYDLGNEFFSLFLDETMTYSSGVFYSNADSLQDASINKLDRICQKLDLNPDHHVLETGTGWGSFAIHAARHYGCRVTTTTISHSQHTLAKQRIQEAGLCNLVTPILQDYRDLNGSYDKVVSIEMIEAVGHQYLNRYFGDCSEMLKPDGQMLLQFISMPDHRYKQYLKTSDFIRKHVFPGSCCPSLSAVYSAIAASTDLRGVQYEDITAHYSMTLEHWRVRFEENIEQVRELGYPEQFIRMWRYYLCYCIAGFAERYIGVGQLLLNKPGCRKPIDVKPLQFAPSAVYEKAEA